MRMTDTPYDAAMARGKQELARQVVDCNDRIEALEEALHRIVQWSEAYPLDVFPEPDWKKARALLEVGGVTLDSVSASCMRRVIEQVAVIARRGLDE